MRKSNENNHLRKRNNIHHNEELKQYVMDLWMSGTREHVIEKLIDKKIREMRRERNMQKSA
mgnify:FL=1